MSYDISDEEFDRALTEVIDTENLKASQLLMVPGIYDVLSEYYNNQAIELIERNREAEEEK